MRACLSFVQSFQCVALNLRVRVGVILEIAVVRGVIAIIGVERDERFTLLIE